MATKKTKSARAPRDHAREEASRTKKKVNTVLDPGELAAIDELATRLGVNRSAALVAATLAALVALGGADGGAVRETLAAAARGAPKPGAKKKGEGGRWG